MQGQVEWVIGRWLSESAMGTALHWDTSVACRVVPRPTGGSDDGSSGALVVVVISACEPEEGVPPFLNFH